MGTRAMAAIGPQPKEPADQTLTSGRARLGKRPSGSAVLNGHVDPSSGEQQGNCRPPEHVKDGISPAPAPFPYPVQHPGLAAAFPIPPIRKGRGFGPAPMLGGLFTLLWPLIRIVKYTSEHTGPSF